MAERAQLPACKTCRSRKRPCDKASPRCTVCEKANVEGIFVDSASGEEYTREQIAALEKQETSLRSQTLGTESPSRPEHPEAPPIPDADGGDGGNSVLEAIFSNPRFHPHRLRQLLVRPSIQQPDATPADFPERATAEFLFANYLSESHLQRPMMLHSDVSTLLQKAYSHEADTALDHQDLYTFFMLCSVSAVRLRRQGVISQHPYSFFLTAQTHAEHINLVSGKIALQNLLLLARFAVYFHTGVSTWDIGRICIHLCVEMELHLPPLTPIPAIEEQHRRILFWESYITDRHNSTILGRPFAIADDEIQVELPANLTEAQAFTLLPGTLPSNTGPPDSESPMAVFIAFIQLRRISSKIHTTYFSKSKRANTQAPIYVRMDALGELFNSFQDLSGQIDAWRLQVPVFARPETFYQMQEWYDFLAEKEQLLLIRGAIDSMHSQTGSPPKELCRLCCDCATKVIQLYSGMYWMKLINCTRHYFQILFTAGLLLAYFSSGGFRDNAAGVGNETGQVESTLAECSQLLRSLGEEMHDAIPYASVFDSICDVAYPNWGSFINHARPMQRHRGNPSQSQMTINEASSFSTNAPMHGTMEYTGMFDGYDPLTDQPVDWVYSPGHLFADVEAYVNQFATGDFTLDPMFNSLSWNMPME